MLPSTAHDAPSSNIELIFDSEEHDQAARDYNETQLLLQYEQDEADFASYCEDCGIGFKIRFACWLLSADSDCVISLLHDRTV